MPTPEEKQRRKDNAATHDVQPCPQCPELGCCVICGAAECELDEFSCNDYLAQKDLSNADFH